MNVNPLPCIICGKQLEPVMRDNDCNQPYGGTSFTSHGHYGSTVFDPMNVGGHLTLEINICDEDMVALAEQKYIYFVERHDNPATFEYKHWDVEHDGDD